MSNRLKRTLVSAVRGTAVIFLYAALRIGRGDSPAALVPWMADWAVLFAAITWYAWWINGDSPKALALQAKAAAKREQRLGQ